MSPIWLVTGERLGLVDGVRLRLASWILGNRLWNRWYRKHLQGLGVVGPDDR